MFCAGTACSVFFRHSRLVPAHRQYHIVIAADRNESPSRLPSRTPDVCSHGDNCAAAARLETSPLLETARRSSCASRFQDACGSHEHRSQRQLTTRLTRSRGDGFSVSVGRPGKEDADAGRWSLGHPQAISRIAIHLQSTPLAPTRSHGRLIAVATRTASAPAGKTVNVRKAGRQPNRFNSMGTRCWLSDLLAAQHTTGTGMRRSPARVDVAKGRAYCKYSEVAKAPGEGAMPLPARSRSTGQMTRARTPTRQRSRVLIDCVGCGASTRAQGGPHTFALARVGIRLQALGYKVARKDGGMWALCRTGY
ncbi:hypothetical protein C8Q79DRAFT_317830 [Trametes meyenii]|nr:hypothetical protein C8Q79DRAFT_317830 [Trametes meyenii]